jgi:hypothetical protein
VSEVVLDDVWGELVTTALLGTDRREPGPLPEGPLGDLVADAVRPNAAGRMLAAVAAVTAARRAAFVSLPAAARLQPPEPDGRPVCSAAAAATWRTVVSEWPVLEDEWMLTVVGQGLRLPPDVLVEALARHRTDAVRRARTALAGGPLTGWLTGHVAALAPAANRRAAPEAVTSLPDLAIPPDLAELVAADAHTFVRAIVPAVDRAGPPQKAVLVNLLARCRPAVLPDATRALTERPYGLAVALADLCRLRARMLAELGRPV